MKSIKSKITVSIVLVLVISLMMLGFINLTLTYGNTMQSIETDLGTIVQVASERVEWEIQAFKNLSSEAGGIAALSDPNVSVEEKKEILAMKAQVYNCQRGNLIDANGQGIDGNTYSDREYFVEAMKGNVSVSEPLVSKITGKITIIVGAPLWKDGIVGSEPVGCVYFVPNEEFLNDIMRSIKISDSCRSYMIDKEGNTIADLDGETILNGENITEAAAEDKSLAALSDIHEKMISGETGFDVYSGDGGRMLIAFAPVGGTDGWSLAISANSKDFTGQMIKTLIICGIVIAAAAAASVIVAFAVGGRIGTPIRLCTERLKKIAEGDLTTPAPIVHNNDETGVLSKTTDVIISDLNKIISDTDHVLMEMSEGNFIVNSECPEVYNGDYSGLHTSMENINHRLSDTLNKINVAADQVSTGADQVADGAQALSLGATTQASSIEELAATMGDMSAHIAKNSERCDSARAGMKNAADGMNAANERMHTLIDAMENINTASDKIGNIIKTIEDIAFQTNILALNAAVEAARAGEAGKGFAVVADEVRNLAGKSAEAAGETTKLIEDSILAVRNGNAVAAETAELMNKAAEASEDVRAIVESIAEAGRIQSDEAYQIVQSIDQISQVTQTNSATAEESAAASEELSGQANMLKELISAFKLRELRY